MSLVYQHPNQRLTFEFAFKGPLEQAVDIRRGGDAAIIVNRNSNGDRSQFDTGVNATGTIIPYYLTGLYQEKSDLHQPWLTLSVIGKRNGTTIVIGFDDTPADA